MEHLNGAERKITEVNKKAAGYQYHPRLMYSEYVVNLWKHMLSKKLIKLVKCNKDKGQASRVILIAWKGEVELF